MSIRENTADSCHAWELTHVYGVRGVRLSLQTFASPHPKSGVAECAHRPHFASLPSHFTSLFSPHFSTLPRRSTPQPPPKKLYGSRSVITFSRLFSHKIPYLIYCRIVYTCKLFCCCTCLQCKHFRLIAGTSMSF